MVQKPKKKPPRPDPLITTVPVIRPCARCGAWLAAGIAEGIHAEVDLVALDAQQVIMAMMVKLDLYCLTRTGLVYMDPSRVQDPRFASRLPEHRCAMRWEAKLQGAGPIVPPVQTDTPPY